MLKENDDCKVRRAIVIPQAQRITAIGGFESVVGWREVYLTCWSRVWIPLGA